MLWIKCSHLSTSWPEPAKCAQWKVNPCFRQSLLFWIWKWTWGERNLVIFEEKPIKTIMKRFRWELSIDMVIHSGICKANQLMLLSRFTVMPKTGVRFYYVLKGWTNCIEVASGLFWMIMRDKRKLYFICKIYKWTTNSHLKSQRMLFICICYRWIISFKLLARPNKLPDISFTHQNLV